MRQETTFSSIETIGLFLEEIPVAVTEYSESLARRLVERITTLDEKIVVVLKSGLQMEVEE